MAEKKEDDILLQNIIEEGDDLIEKIIENKTVKSHYVREDDGKLIALQFPVQDREFWDGVEKTYEKLKQQACSISGDENVEILRIFVTLEHFLNLDFITGSFMLYAREFQEAYVELRGQTALLKGIFESLAALKQNEEATSTTLQQLFIKKLLQVGRFAFRGAFNMGRSKKWAILAPVHGRAELWSGLAPGETPEPFHLSISTEEEKLFSLAMETVILMTNKAIDRGLLQDENPSSILENLGKLLQSLNSGSIENEEVFRPDVVQELLEPNEKQKLVLENPWRFVPDDISPSVSDLNSWKEPEWFRDYREKAYKVKEDQMTTLKKLNDPIRKWDKRGKKDLKKKYENLTEQVQIIRDGWPNVVARYNQECDQYESKRKEKARKMEEHKSKRKQKEKLVLLDE